MGYKIVFQDKYIDLGDGQYLYLERSGCNNDTEGRKKDIYTAALLPETEVIHIIDGYLEANEDDDWVMKIGSRQVNLHQYGKHLKTMFKRAITWDATRMDSGATLIDQVNIYFKDKDVTGHLDIEEWSQVWTEYVYNKSTSVGFDKHFTNDIDEIVAYMSKNPHASVEIKVVA